VVRSPGANCELRRRAVRPKTRRLERESGRWAASLTPQATQIGDKWQIAGDKGALVEEKSGEIVRLRDVRPRVGPGADDLVRWRLTKF